MKKTLLCFAVTAIAAATLAAAPLTLVKDGVPSASIVIAAEKPSRAAQFAAYEIQHHVKLITGAVLPIVNDQTPVAGVKILVGDSLATRAMGIKREDFKGEEYMVKCVPEAIVLIGNDTYDARVVNYQDPVTFPNSYYYAPLDNATLWAAYDFLEKGCDIRHYAPTEIGITFTPRSTLTVEMSDIRRQPTMDAFRVFHAPEMSFERGKRFDKRDVVLFKLRLRNTERFDMANHNAYSIYYKYYRRAVNSPYKEAFVESRPDYFAQGYAGKSSQFLIADRLRKEYPGDNDLPPQPCFSNRAVIEHFAQEAVAAYSGTFAVGVNTKARSSAGAPFYYPIEPDDNSAVCQCGECRKLFPEKSGEERAGYLKWYWVNEIARRTAEINPQVGIVTLAYNYNLSYPEGMKLSPNLAVQMCLKLDRWQPDTPFGNKQRQAYQQWIKANDKPLLSIWTYFMDPGYDAKLVYKYDHFFPGFYATPVAAQFKDFAKNGIRGWFGQSQDEIGLPFWYDQLEFYTAARLADDPSLDSEKLISEFFIRYYGAAAKPMREFYRIVAEAYVNPKTYPQDWLNTQPGRGLFSEEISWGSLGTKERMQKLGALMAEAKSLVQTPVEKQRLEWFDTGLWQSMLTGRANYDTKEKFRTRPVSEVSVPKIASGNGDPSQVDWGKAVSVNWKTINGFPLSDERTLQLIHDGTYLYVRYSDPQDATKLETQKDIWGGDVLEMFFAAVTERPYNHFAVNPADRTYAMSYYNKDMATYESAWTSDVKLQNRAVSEGWTVLAAFPLAKLLPDGIVKTGSEFRANFFRGSPGKVAQAWSPIFELNFHTLTRMGKIKLAE